MRRPGFTLVEIVVSSFIIGLLVVSLLGLVQTGYLAVRRGERTLQADNVAQSLLEEKRAGSFDALVPGSKTESPVITGGATYNPVVTVTTRPGTDPNVLREVGVTVTWEERGRTFQVVHRLSICNVRR